MISGYIVRYSVEKVVVGLYEYWLYFDTERKQGDASTHLSFSFAMGFQDVDEDPMWRHPFSSLSPFGNAFPEVERCVF